MVLSGKSDGTTCTTLTNDVTPLKTALQIQQLQHVLDCTNIIIIHWCSYCVDSGTYSGSTSLPTVLAGKCDGTTCTTLTTDVTALKACMSTPTNAACTATYGSAGKSFCKKINNIAFVFVLC